MSYYDHATMIVYRLGPWAQAPEPPLDVPAGRRRQEHALVTGPSRGKMRVGKNSVSKRLGGFWFAYQRQGAAAQAGGAARRRSRETRAMVT
jgi:hypothetical protein